jgi:hypothetical protein
MATLAGLGSFEKLILSVESASFGTLYRTGIGFAIIPAYSSILATQGWRDTPGKLLLFLLAVLFTLRIAPGVARRVLPFSREVKQEWAELRNLAKTYDSFQWKKLLGIGLGLTAYLVSSGLHRADAIALATICTVGGVAGWLFWLRISRAIETIQ